MFIHNIQNHNKENENNGYENIEYDHENNGYENDEYDNEEHNNDMEEEEEYISDGELIILEGLANHAYKSYTKHMAAVEEYEAALEKRRLYDERHAVDNERSKETYSSSNSPKADVDEVAPDPFLEALRVYDDEGYNIDGFNSQGYDRENFNRAGFNRYDGYDRGGYNINGDSRGSGLSRFPKL